MSERHLSVFICEDEELARQLVRQHLDKGKLTYCNMLPEDTDRAALIDSIETHEHRTAPSDSTR